MRKFLFVALAAATLTFVAVPQKASAQWVSTYYGQPYYTGSYTYYPGPAAYTYPAYSYYSYAYPTYSTYYSAPYYRSYWYGSPYVTPYRSYYYGTGYYRPYRGWRRWWR